MKKLVSLLLVAILALSLCSVAGAEEEKPVLKVINMSQSYNYEDQPANAAMEEMTGYKVEWYMQPTENGDQMVMMWISGGDHYDMLFAANPGLTRQLKEAGLLMPLNDLIAEYAPELPSHVAEAAMKTVTDEDGTIFGLPKESILPLQGTAKYGLQQYGLMFNCDLLKEIGKELPTTLDEFYDVCKAYTEATGNPAFTSGNSVWEIHSIMPAFGMGAAVWYPTKDGQFLHRLQVPAVVDYLTFMQKMYAEGLWDQDFPINSDANAKEKFTSGKALCYVSAFFNYDNVMGGFEASDLHPELKFVPGLGMNEGDPHVLYRTAGVNYDICIPVTAEHPEDAMKWLSIISTDENFRRIFIGEEGVSYEVRDGEYYPIYPTFNDYVNSDKFVGVPDATNYFDMWKARARKTETIAASFDQINADYENFDVRYVWESYAAGRAGISEHEDAINTIIGDALLPLIVDGGDVAETIAQIMEDVQDEGWDEYAAAYADFYKDFASSYDWTID